MATGCDEILECFFRCDVSWIFFDAYLLFVLGPEMQKQREMKMLMQQTDGEEFSNHLDLGSLPFI